MAWSATQRFGHRGRNMGAFSIATPIVFGHTPLNDEAGEAAKDVSGLDGGAAHLESSNSTSWLHVSNLKFKNIIFRHIYFSCTNSDIWNFFKRKLLEKLYLFSVGVFLKYTVFENLFEKCSFFRVYKASGTSLLLFNTVWHSNKIGAHYFFISFFSGDHARPQRSSFSRAKQAKQPTFAISVLYAACNQAPRSQAYLFFPCLRGLSSEASAHFSTAQAAENWCVEMLYFFVQRV